MAITHLLEDFSTGDTVGNVMSLMSEDSLEDLRLDSFEKGYSAGWEDAFAAQDKDRTRIAAGLADCLGDMSFTYQEALSEMMRSVQPVLCNLVDLVLPEIMQQTIGNHITEQLCDMVRDQASGAASVVVPIGARASLASILTLNMPMPVKITEDASLDPGRAYLRLGTSEREIDSTALITSIRDSVDAFNYQINEDLKNA
ncbi:MAG: ABC transporter ATP-binding protein [Rhodobacteraceae bacterium]|nr:ABC transporter ATP-binding protein [Paracoccaceae bacterium]